MFINDRPTFPMYYLGRPRRRYEQRYTPATGEPAPRR